MIHPEKFVPRGVAYHHLESDPAPQDIAFVLSPKLSMLAFSSAIEPLRIANQLTGKLLYRWFVYSETGAAVACSNGIEISVDGPLPELDRKTSLFICSGLEPQRHSSATIAGLVRRHWRMGAVVGGLCTGAYTLARAGILGNSAFTLHWENLTSFTEIFPQLEPTDQLYVVDDRIMTCSGGTASSDLFLHLIEETHGRGLARAVADMCLKGIRRGRQDRQKSSLSAEIGSRNPKLVKIVERIHDRLSGDISLQEIADEFGISRRQVERLFKHHLGVSPKKYVLDTRLTRARQLLSETNMSTAEVSAAIGFNSSSHFSNRFHEKFGVRPSQF